MADTPDSKKRCCSFCGRSEDDVTLLFPSADGKTYICDGCVDICSDFLDEHFKAPEEVEDVEEITYETLPRPMEITAPRMAVTVITSMAKPCSVSQSLAL